jgi:hypothetical protein
VSGAWCWFAVLEERADDATAQAPATTITGEPAGWLAAWPNGRKPTRDAVRMDGRIVDRDGTGARVYVTLLDRGREPLFDDPTVSGAMRAILAGPPADAVTTFVRDSSHFSGGLSVWRDGLPHDDPFVRLGPSRVFDVGPGLFGRLAPPPGPVIQRYAGQPWPMAGF